MILTGKAKKDFLEWNHHIKNDDHGYIDMEPRSILVGFSELDKNLQHSLIIDWFDSVGIHLTISYWVHTTKWQYVHLGFYSSDFKYNSRYEATEQAIKHANEIYNERNNTTNI